MRIISGHFKGKKILEPKNKNTRPLKDLVKESIFNIIHHSKKFNIDIEDSIILDLFSLSCVIDAVEGGFSCLTQDFKSFSLSGFFFSFSF